MKTMKATKQAKYYYKLFLVHKGRTLEQCYSKPSHKKLKAYNDTWFLVKQFNGKNLTVLSYNTWMFTLGFTCQVIDNNGEEIECFVVRTPSYDSVYKISEL